MAQLHNGAFHCIKRDGKNGKMLELVVSKDEPKYYELRIYRRLPNATMKEDMVLTFGRIEDARNKYNEYLKRL